MSTKRQIFLQVHNVPVHKTDVILYDVAATICQFDVTAICTNTVRSISLNKMRAAF